MSQSKYWDVLRNVHVCIRGEGKKRPNKREKRESVGKRRHLGFINGNLADQVHCLLKLYIFDTEILEDGALANGMHPVVSKH